MSSSRQQRRHPRKKKDGFGGEKFNENSELFEKPVELLREYSSVVIEQVGNITYSRSKECGDVCGIKDHKIIFTGPTDYPRVDAFRGMWSCEICKVGVDDEFFYIIDTKSDATDSLKCSGCDGKMLKVIDKFVYAFCPECGEVDYKEPIEDRLD